MQGPIATRYGLLGGPLTATRVPFADADGRLTDDSGLTFAAATDILSVGGAVRLANGTKTAPSFSFTNFTSTGFYVAAGPELYASVSDTNIARFASAGLVMLSGTISMTDNGIQHNNGNAGIAPWNAVMEFTEQSGDASAPAANKARMYLKDNGAGKTQLVVRFPTGAVQQIAIEP